MTQCDPQFPRPAPKAGANLGWTALNLLAATVRLSWKAGRMGAISKALRGEGRHGQLTAHVCPGPAEALGECAPVAHCAAFAEKRKPNE